MVAKLARPHEERTGLETCSTVFGIDQARDTFRQLDEATRRTRIRWDHEKAGHVNPQFTLGFGARVSRTSGGASDFADARAGRIVDAASVAGVYSTYLLPYASAGSLANLLA